MFSGGYKKVTFGKYGLKRITLKLLLPLKSSGSTWFSDDFRGNKINQFAFKFA